MTVQLGAPPVLSTPDTHILNDTTASSVATPSTALSEEEFDTKYEIQRTLDEIRDRKWRRVALQFPDEMLHDAPRVFQLLSRGLKPSYKGRSQNPSQTDPDFVQEQTQQMSIQEPKDTAKLFILADTSYGSCCVDEVAAEHVNADSIVHYGRACLSPTARLPVLHVFTQSKVDLGRAISSFTETFPSLETKVIITADITYTAHVSTLNSSLVARGYTNLHAAEIVHDPSSPIPNRTVPAKVMDDPEELQGWHVYHIAQPPTSLLLTLSSRVAGFHIFSADSTSSSRLSSQSTYTSAMLRRRYALVTNLATVPIWGILINTLSVKNYLHMVDHVKKLIDGAGKKSYMFVVGKLNTAKVANFSEIGGWVVIGCWESSLIDSQDFYKPVITPFELTLALSSDSDRIWTGQWRSDFQSILNDTDSLKELSEMNGEQSDALQAHEEEDYSEPESAPPEYDLRTGKYVSHSRPMRTPATRSENPASRTMSSALTKKGQGGMISINGTTSPAAEFLKNKRTWQGLGSDFEIRYEDNEVENGSLIQEGRNGIARGYTIGGSDKA
ncbi:putative diphthamide biosynthesis protein [Phaeomoniella chlamydospora]|uniref:2-(3-amino-3-carboxypropyl)histidine synthase subunit 2 n=1 Tax=Phaeomoniella chlamydospora TaxID=158046 RepID=A0A0G2DXQ7_PHACM|nr:putative diphthamide biosynthesis protein [Phaeomoniella chlamydospora]